MYVQQIDWLNMTEYAINHSVYAVNCDKKINQSQVAAFLVHKNSRSTSLHLTSFAFAAIVTNNDNTTNYDHGVRLEAPALTWTGVHIQQVLSCVSEQQSLLKCTAIHEWNKHTNDKQRDNIPVAELNCWDGVTCTVIPARKVWLYAIDWKTKYDKDIYFNATKTHTSVNLHNTSKLSENLREMIC